MSSFLQDLANELMAREPVPTLRNVATVDRSKRQSMQRGQATQDAMPRKEQKRALNQARQPLKSGVGRCISLGILHSVEAIRPE